MNLAIFIKIVSALALSTLTLFALSFFVSSIGEKESKASVYSGIQVVIFIALLILFFTLNSTGYFDSGTGFGILTTLLVLAVLTSVFIFTPIGGNPKALEGTRGLITGDVERVDERDIEFSKAIRKMMDSPPADDRSDQEFYGKDPPGPEAGMFITPREGLKFPEKPENSDLNVGRIDGPGGVVNVAMSHVFSAAASSLATPDKISPNISEKKIKLSPSEAAVRVKGFAKQAGAVLVGITELNPLWVYSNRGSSDVKNWGSEINIDHKFAIVFAVEMDFESVNTSPHTPEIVETQVNYAKGAYIAYQLASFIAELGYPAKANQMAHYDCMMVPLAVDAGLGELSRMGFLITKEYGPRVRLGAVTTDLPLVPDKPVDIGVVDFCEKCKKCAHCCPSKSISKDERREVNGTLRWTIDTESCFAHWHKLGTDCSICMRVCPWSHARTFPHRVITEAVTRNAISRTIFNSMDDLFYGRRPGSKPPPDWLRYD